MPELDETLEVAPPESDEALLSIPEERLPGVIQDYVVDPVENARLYRLLKFLGLLEIKGKEEMPSSAHPPSGAFPPSGALPPSGGPVGGLTGGAAAVDGSNVTADLLKAPSVPVDTKDTLLPQPGTMLRMAALAGGGGNGGGDKGGGAAGYGQNSKGSTGFSNATLGGAGAKEQNVGGANQLTKLLDELPPITGSNPAKADTFAAPTNAGSSPDMGALSPNDRIYRAAESNDQVRLGMYRPLVKTSFNALALGRRFVDWSGDVATSVGGALSSAGRGVASHSRVRKDILSQAQEIRDAATTYDTHSKDLGRLRDLLKDIPKLPKGAPPNPMHDLQQTEIRKAIGVLTNVKGTGLADRATETLAARNLQMDALKDQLLTLKQREGIAAGVGVLGLGGVGVASLTELKSPSALDYFKFNSDDPFERVMRTKFAQSPMYYGDSPAGVGYPRQLYGDFESMGAMGDEKSRRFLAQAGALGLGAGGAYMLTPWGASASAESRMRPIRELLGGAVDSDTGKLVYKTSPSGQARRLAIAELKSHGLEPSSGVFRRGLGTAEAVGAEMPKLQRDLARKIRARRLLPFMLLGGGAGLGLLATARRELGQLTEAY